MANRNSFGSLAFHAIQRHFTRYKGCPEQTSNCNSSSTDSILPSQPGAGGNGAHAWGHTKLVGHSSISVPAQITKEIDPIYTSSAAGHAYTDQAFAQSTTAAQNLWKSNNRAEHLPVLISPSSLRSQRQHLVIQVMNGVNMSNRAAAGPHENGVGFGPMADQLDAGQEGAVADAGGAE